MTAQAPETSSGAGDQGRVGSPTPAEMAPFASPTQLPNEPVTAGADLGPGIGPDAAGIVDDRAGTLEQLRPLLPSLELAANLPGASPAARTYVRNLKTQLASRP
jgi:hypothetical protein